ncbi:23S rRNA (cytidine1920-2'-O)/16S rRNA (cytidine1409-2'-O)-methyltransferase [Lipingzhangella halophila]|uniref:23S rRNA (Cytidine1920-2'-O)/16S rRNA (Cytidine1409-2'-O)-methyltransferase n=1 Tax=Lipingzhangella halophila TaxID=1783352 RepID=A0A7W7W365_9ACTN|nr:TlyA family RNA methyltransferase [Lipingzhangella halophila]MBB4932461.1 23S rRNA (cytidine1920-2'-O)/16S rRNA (cytidine1409-2'-O)-methyltransferase [Lipingzhangella halophila]
MAKRTRLDAELVRRGFARSRGHAAELIGAGHVHVVGLLAGKPATQVSADQAIVVRAPSGEPSYVSRGAHKLIGALDAFGTDSKGRSCLDAGASTGGFTEVLLRRGAARVVAVDVGYGQLAWPLRNDDRVVVRERCNVRELTPEQVGEPRPDLVVADLSFISLTLVLPALAGCAAPDAEFLLMVKPQFEVGRERVGAGGVVRGSEARADAVRAVAACALELGLGAAGVAASPLPGPAGNVEYFLLLRSGAAPLDEDRLGEALAEGPQ